MIPVEIPPTGDIIVRPVNLSKAVVATVLMVVTTAACSPTSGDDGMGAHPAAPTLESAATMDESLPSRAEWERMHSRIVAQVDSIDRALLRVRPLSSAEQGELRRDLNATQIATARRLGIPRGAEVEPLVRSGRLVRLADTTAHWIVRELDFSQPYVTPDAHAMLVELGERFHARLDSLGLPRYRFEITSVLRTRADQAALIRVNANASRGLSAHELATTVDVAYRRFAPPEGLLEELDLQARPPLDAVAREVHDSLLVETASVRGSELQAVLGRVIREMRAEGKLLVRMERRQTVYHMTVARRY
jgi:hypothetical protein